jgi:hypothetical protein
LIDQGPFTFGTARGSFGTPAIDLVTRIGEAHDEVAVRQRRFADR